MNWFSFKIKYFRREIQDSKVHIRILPGWLFQLDISGKLALKESKKQGGIYTQSLFAE